MALLNPSFEDEGALPGEAAHWMLAAVTSAQVLAGFGAAPELAWEDFERWFELADDLARLTTARGFFNGARDGFEAFEHGWSLGVYLWELPPAQTVAASLGPDEVESCESGWSNVPFLREWSEVASTTGQFDGEPREDFEDAWRANEAFAWSWPSVTSATAGFDSGAQSVEDFNDGWAHAVSQ
jgi:hypothetical protein